MILIIILKISFTTNIGKGQFNMPRIKKKEIEYAEKSLDGIIAFEELSSLSLQELFGFQRLIGYAIEEKLQEQKG